MMTKLVFILLFYGTRSDIVYVLWVVRSPFVVEKLTDSMFMKGCISPHSPPSPHHHHSERDDSLSIRAFVGTNTSRSLFLLFSLPFSRRGQQTLAKNMNLLAAAPPPTDGERWPNASNAMGEKGGSAGMHVRWDEARSSPDMIESRGTFGTGRVMACFPALIHRRENLSAWWFDEKQNNNRYEGIRNVKKSNTFEISV